MKLASIRIQGTLVIGEGVGRDRFEAPTPIEILPCGWVQIGPFVVPPDRVLEGRPFEDPFAAVVVRPGDTLPSPPAEPPPTEPAPRPSRRERRKRGRS